MYISTYSAINWSTSIHITHSCYDIQTEKLSKLFWGINIYLCGVKWKILKLEVNIVWISEEGASSWWWGKYENFYLILTNLNSHAYDKLYWRLYWLSIGLEKQISSCLNFEVCYSIFATGHHEILDLKFSLFVEEMPAVIWGWDCWTLK